MVRHGRRFVPVAGALLLFLLGLSASNVAAADDGPVDVLLQTSSWRMHHTLKPPVIAYRDGPKPYLLEQQWLNADTAGPADGWQQVDFDDSGWARRPANMAAESPYLARLCLRGKFRVTNPSRVGGLTLSLRYCGAAVVYLNGKEVRRAHVAAVTRDEEALAEPYPEEAFVTEDRKLLVPGGGYTGPGRKLMRRPTEESARRINARARGMEDIRIPSSLLRPGVNVLAIEIIRAPYHAVLCEASIYEGRSSPAFDWSTCEIRGITLRAQSAAGLVPNVGRPAALQVWNRDPLVGDTDADWGDPCEPLRPITMAGARNGIFSGKVLVGSSEAIRDLRCAASDLERSGGGRIPASAIRVRYGLPWGRQAGTWGQLLSSLADAPLAEFPASERGGAVVPVWVTVSVPKDAAPGTYSGQVTIRAAGAAPVAVPVALTVAGWTLPDPGQYVTWVDLVQSPDTLSLEYNVPLWSQKHWDLVGRSMDLMAEAGNKTLYVPLIARTNLGNEQSMVRWIERDDGRCDFDFSVLERYLDMALKHMGRPEAVIVNVWDVYMISKDYDLSDREAKRERKSVGKARMAQVLTGRGVEIGKGPLVTLVDPKTGKTETAYVPECVTAQGKALWKTVLDGVRSRLKERGLDPEKVMLLGMFSDAAPSRQVIETCNEIAPGIRWALQAHNGPRSGKVYGGINMLGYQAVVWTVGFADNVSHHGVNPEGTSLHGWAFPIVVTNFERNMGLDVYPASRWRWFCEANITGEQRGVGRMGGDLWEVVRDKSGRRRGRVHIRYPEADWRNLDLNNTMLAPAPGGPASTSRFEAFREGVEECEARIFIEKALMDAKLKARLGPKLAARCQAVLDGRMTYMWKSMSNLELHAGGFNATAWRWRPGVAGHVWFLETGWQNRTRELFDLAGEVAARLEGP